MAATTTRAAKTIVGYADPLSVRAGDALSVFVSCEGAGEFNASLVRLVSGDDRPHGTGFAEVALDAEFAGRYPATHQPLVRGSYAVLPDMPESQERAFGCYFYPTLLEQAEQTLLRGGDCRVSVSTAGLSVHLGPERFDVAASLQLQRWHRLVVSIGTQLSMHIERQPRGPAEKIESWELVATPQNELRFPREDWELARGGPGLGHFNGRIEAMRIYGAAVGVALVANELDVARPQGPDLLGAWDFSEQIESERLVDVSGHGRHGFVVQLPTRGVTGVRWRGEVFDWREDPAQYGAIHFHDDDLVDAGWRASFRWTVPDTLPSGVYAVKLALGDSEDTELRESQDPESEDPESEDPESEDYVPFFVRPAQHHARAPVAYLIPTATYLAYANQRFGFSSEVFGTRPAINANDIYMLDHPELGDSLYEYHRDRSGVHFSSRLRPILNLKPKGTAWAFTADTNITAWLEHIEARFDVITDEDLHREGAAALAPYLAVITGTHPEYHSTAMLDGLREWLDRGGRLMYMGGNGFYWRIAYHPQNPAIIEVRRAEDGTRAWIAEPGEYHHAFTGEYGGLWRRLGRPPNALVGVGFAAQGFDGGTYYRVQPDAVDPRVAFILRGVDAGELLGNHGTQGGGAAGEEIDRFDITLGSPRHALVIASSENHKPGMLRVKEELHMSIHPGADPRVRADMTFFETPAGGAVFSTGSISYAGSLSTNGYDNDIARLTGNVLRRFIDPAPFVYPA